MASFSLLADLIHQCRLARGEEDDSSLDALQIPPHDSFAVRRLVCVGQRVRITVRADHPVSASIKLEDCDDAPALRHSADSTNLSIEYFGERTAEHVLTVENDNAVPVEVVVEIVMELRGGTTRTLIERAVNTVFDAFRRRKTKILRVVPSKRSPNREDGTASTDSPRATGA